MVDAVAMDQRFVGFLFRQLFAKSEDVVQAAAEGEEDVAKACGGEICEYLTELQSVVNELLGWR